MPRALVSSYCAGARITKWGCPPRSFPVHLLRLPQQGTTRAPGNLSASDTRLLLKKWMEERKPVLCLGSFNECRVVLEATVFSVSKESFTLRSLRSDSTLMFSFGSEGTTFDYAEQREFGMSQLPPGLEELSSISILFPARIPLTQTSSPMERESLILIELWDAKVTSRPKGD